MLNYKSFVKSQSSILKCKINWNLQLHYKLWSTSKHVGIPSKMKPPFMMASKIWLHWTAHSFKSFTTLSDRFHPTQQCFSNLGKRWRTKQPVGRTKCSMEYTRENLSSCNKFVNKPSTLSSHCLSQVVNKFGTSC
jgi:hypothetical protein